MRQSTRRAKLKSIQKGFIGFCLKFIATLVFPIYIIIVCLLLSIFFCVYFLSMYPPHLADWTYLYISILSNFPSIIQIGHKDTNNFSYMQEMLIFFTKKLPDASEIPHKFLPDIQQMC